MTTAKSWAEIAAGLAEPFDPSSIKFRIGSRTRDKRRGMVLHYVDARDVMERLDQVVGMENWQDQYQASTAYTGQIICLLGIRELDGSGWIWKSDGAGATGMESEKGSLSDAFKRAAVKWGVGRYLYALPSHWVSLENEGRSIPEGELARLYKAMGVATVPEDALASPEGMSSPSSSSVGSGRPLTKAQLAEIEKLSSDPKSKPLGDILVALYDVPRDAISGRTNQLAWIKEKLRQGALEGFLRALKGEAPVETDDF